MMGWQFSISIIVLELSLKTAGGANILFLCSTLSPSHSFFCHRYMSLLVERGHQITLFGIDHPKSKMVNVTTFIADDVYGHFSNRDPKDAWYIGEDAKLRTLYFTYIPITKESSQIVLQSKALQDLIKHYRNKKNPFDLIIHDATNGDALLGLVPLFGDPPLMSITPAPSPQWMDTATGNPIHLAYTPTMISGFGQRMTFYERIVNTVHFLFLEWMRAHLLDFQDQLKRQVLGEGLPHVREIAKRSNVVLYSHHFALDGPRPMLPGVIGVSGLHITEPHPLPKDLDDFISGAENGVIIMSFGTNINSKYLPPNFATLMLEAFKTLKQRVLWKWQENLPNQPPHVRISQWLPQGDILAHPNVRLFISHCGMHGIQESLHRGVPLLAIPIFFDQRENAERLVMHNLSIQLNVAKMTPEEVTGAIQEMITNPLYKTNTAKTSELLRDMPQTAQEQAVFWTEYVIRHKGAPHLHSVAADMPTYQLLMLDVLAFAVVVACVFIRLTKRLALLLWRKISSQVFKTKSE